MSRFIRIAAFLALIAVLISACAAAPSRTSEEAAPPIEPGGGFRDDSVGEAPVAGPGKPQSSTAERLVIRTATLNIIVDDPADALSAIARMADEMQGYVVTQNLTRTTGANGVQYPQATITIRVPAEKLNQAMDQIKALVNNPDDDVLSENVTGQDVTSEYTDLRSRLKNLQASEEQLREIMASATKTEDVLAVQQQLTQVREQIEVIQGQIKYYEEAAALSSISVNIQARASIQPLEVGGWRPVGVARDAIQALIFALQALATIAIWGVLFLLPIGLVIALPILLVVWVVRRGLKRRKAPVQPAS